jgi:hypothetical protein
MTEHIGEIVTRYFICGLGARDAVPVSYSERYTRVSVHWDDGTRWNVLCMPDFFRGTGRVVPPAADQIRHWRTSLSQGSEPVVALVRMNSVELSGKEGFPLSTYDLPVAA